MVSLIPKPSLNFSRVQRTGKKTQKGRIYLRHQTEQRDRGASARRTMLSLVDPRQVAPNIPLKGVELRVGFQLACRVELEFPL